MGNIRYIILLLSLFNFSLCINEEINIITYLSKVTNDSLKSLALATEKYSRRKVKVQPEHGLADYYDKLNDIEVIEYLLREIKSEGLIQGHKHFPVWIDSPLAVEATKIYAGGMMDYYDAETIEMIKKGIDPLRFDGLSVSVTTQDSVRLN